jgi:hypothetical protein
MCFERRTVTYQRSVKSSWSNIALGGGKWGARRVGARRRVRGGGGTVVGTERFGGRRR